MAITTRVQRKYLLDLLATEERHRSYSIKERPDPAAVRRARDAVKKWDKAEALRKERERIVIRNRAHAVREIVLFGDPQAALKAVQAFKEGK